MGQEAAKPEFDDSQWETVSIPHDWNALGGSGVGAFDKALYWYRSKLTLSEEEAQAYNEKSAFLRFGAVGMEAAVFWNGELLDWHMGGWSAFSADISGRFKAGENLVAVSADNTDNPSLAPLHGDFNRASGINREAELILAPKVHFDLMDHGSRGVYISPERVGGDRWRVGVRARVMNGEGRQRITIRAAIRHPERFDHSLDAYFPVEKLRFDPDDMCDSSGAVIGEASASAYISGGAAREIALSVENIASPRLWDGLQSPYRYIARVELLSGGETLDVYETHIGFRYYEALRKEGTYDDPENGFFLNGRRYPLRGIALHHDWPGLGRALTWRHIAADIGVMYEMGVNWARTSHYPHPELTYDILSRYGIACSAEIPLIDGVGMTRDKAHGVLSPEFKERTLFQLEDMIKQLYNYPAILGWLLQNELGGGTYGQGAEKEALAAQTEMVGALNSLAHSLDPERKTMMAMSLPHCYQFDADLLLWNNYPGWYSVVRTGIGAFVDEYRDADTKRPKRPTGVSEYGAGMNPYEHYDFDESADAPMGFGDPWHPEEYGCDRHEVSIREINARPFYWATAGWIMFDFSAAYRSEGGRAGINDKGLVRKERPQDAANYDGSPESLMLRKDAFYLYKANWNPEPLTYIAARRFSLRRKKNICVTVYSNARRVELFHNGIKIGAAEKTERTDGTETGSCIFKFSVVLEEGQNAVMARGICADGSVESRDSVIWEYIEPIQADAPGTRYDGVAYLIAAKPGAKIAIDHAKNLIHIPIGIPDFYNGGDMTGGLVYSNVAASLSVGKGCRIAFNNDADYSLTEATRLIVTDSRGNKTSYGFKFIK